MTETKKKDSFKPYMVFDAEKAIGVPDRFFKGADFNDLSKGATENDDIIFLGVGSQGVIPNPLINVTIRAASGSLTNPGISWAVDEDTGFYWVSDGAMEFGSNTFRRILFDGSGLSLVDIVQHSVLFTGAGGLISSNSALTYNASTATFSHTGATRLGSASDASTAGDLSAGLSGGARLFYDQSLSTLSLYDSSSNEDLSLDVAGNSWYNGAGNFGFGTTSPDNKVEITSSTGTQLRLSHTDSNNSFCTFSVDSSGNLNIDPWTAAIIMSTASGDSANGPVFFECTCTDDGNAVFEASTLGAGDAFIELAVNSFATTWAVGVDNSASDSFKISKDDDLGTNDRLTMTVDGYTTMTPGVLATGTAHAFQVTGPINTGGTNGLFKLLASASTGQTASTEIRFAFLDLSAITTWATGALANERAVYIAAPTLAFAGSSTVTNAATVYIDRAPQAGTNATITNAYALWVDDGAVRFDGAVSAASFTISGLTSGRVTFATTGGALTDDAGFTFDGVTLTLSDSNSATTPLHIFNQASTGDSAIRWSLATTISYAMGIDNSVAGDPFVLSTAASGTAVLGTGNIMSITSAGAMTIPALITTSSITNNGLTSGRVTFASTSGLLADDAGFTFDGVTLTLSDSNAATTPLAIFNQASTGDSAIRWSLATTISYAMGIDNSVAGDPFVISTAASGTAVLGTGNILSITSAGTATLPAIVATSSITNNGLTATRVTFAGASGLLTDDAGLTYVAADDALSVAGWLEVGTATDAAAAGEFSSGISGSGRMHFKRRSQAVSDGLASELTAFIDGSGWLRIIGNNANEFFDFSTYQYGHLISFRNATQQLEFWGYETVKGSVQAICTMIPSDAHNKFQVRNLADNDAIEVYFGSGTSGPMITTEVSTFWDLGLLTSRYIRLTSTEFQMNSGHALTWSDGAVGSTSDITLERASAGLLDLTGAMRISSTLTLSLGTDTRVLFFGASGLVTDDGGLTYNSTNDALTVSGRLFVGTATDAAAQGDFVAGLTGNARIFYDQSAAALQMFSTDGSDDWTLTARTDGNLRITSQATAPQLQWQEDKAGQEMILLVRNTNASNTAGGATVEPFVSSAGGDPKFVWAITGGTSWYAGPDNSDSDTFMIGTGTAIGTNAFLKYTTGALLTLIQPTVGNELFRLESTATNDDPSDRFYHGRVATTDATVTTINTIAIAASTTVMIEAQVRARRTGGTSGTAEDGAGYVVYGTYKNVAGTATLIGAVSADYTAEDQAGWDATLAVSGGNVLLRVTGAANNNVTWHSTVIVRQVSS